jgi:hypothetical protein
MATIHPLFGSILEQHLPGLQEPPIELEEEDEFVACDSCGQPSTHDMLDPGDPSVGISSYWVPMCDDCDTRSGRAGEV